MSGDLSLYRGEDGQTEVWTADAVDFRVLERVEKCLSKGRVANEQRAC